MTVLVNLDYSVPGLVVADEKKKKKLHPRTGFAPGEGIVFIHLTTKDQLTDNCTDYLSNLINIHQMIAE